MRRSDLEGIVLIDVTLPLVPFTIFTKNEDTGKQSVDGLGPNLLQKLQVNLNFTTVAMPPPDNLWGNQLENGN